MRFLKVLPPWRLWQPISLAPEAADCFSPFSLSNRYHKSGEEFCPPGACGNRFPWRPRQPSVFIHFPSRRATPPQKNHSNATTANLLRYCTPIGKVTWLLLSQRRAKCKPFATYSQAKAAAIPIPCNRLKLLWGYEARPGKAYNSNGLSLGT